MAPRKKSSSVKNTVKFLASCKDPQLVQNILRKGDKQLVKAICNAAFNVTQGEIALGRATERKFVKARPVFEALTRKDVPLEQKHKAIQTGRGLPLLALIIPPLLSAVLSSVGSSLFQK